MSLSNLIRTDSIKPLKNCLRSTLVLTIVFSLINDYLLITDSSNQAQGQADKVIRRNLIILASGHIVLTRDDRQQSLVLTGEDGKGGGNGDQLVISGNNMGGGGGQSSNMVMQDAANREGDVVMNGNSMIIPGEDGHIVLADSRNSNGGGRGNGGQGMMQNPFALWMPYMYGRSSWMMPFFGGQFVGGQFG